jgi:hypothetical protein
MSFAVDVHASYLVHNVIPPRCRKPRTVTRETDVRVEIREVDGIDAPVAFEVDNVLTHETDQWRWYADTLYRLYRPHAHQKEPSEPGSIYFPAYQNLNSWVLSDVIDEADAHAQIRHHFGQYLIVDGVVWREASEPLYVVATFGMGYNHASTALMDTQGVNPNIALDCYFRADEHEAARAKAIKVALGRGDTDSVPRIQSQDPLIRIHVPEAVRFASLTSMQPA